MSHDAEHVPPSVYTPYGFGVNVLQTIQTGTDSIGSLSKTRRRCAGYWGQLNNLESLEKRIHCLDEVLYLVDFDEVFIHQSLQDFKRLLAFVHSTFSNVDGV